MKHLRSISLGLFLALAALPQARAQWSTESFDMVAGWTAIFLHVDATHSTPDDIFAAFPEVDEVWRWNPQTTSTQFISDPSLPDAGLPEWNVWRRGFPIDSDLTDMPGNRAYLLNVASGASPFTLQVQGRPVPPHYT